MTARPHGFTPARTRRGGGILLELLLAIALFATAASFTLSAMRGAVDAIRRAELRARAFDLASTRLAELDAGMVAIGDLGEARPREDGLSVTVEIIAAAGTGVQTSLARARATVRDESDPTGAEPVIVAVHERTIDLRERSERRTR
jgi:type II secretory pathway component PulJ